MSLVTQAYDALRHSLCPLFTIISNTFNPLVRSSVRKIPRTLVRPPARQGYLYCSRRIHPSARFSLNRGYGQNIRYSSYLGHEYVISDTEVLRKISKSAVYEELRKAITKSDYHRIQRIIRVLVKERGEAPNSRIYTALILANTSPGDGSAEGVDELLQEMVGENITPDSATYHAVLKVLAIHPDYMLRNEVLDELKSRWFTLTNDGWHDVVAGCIRDRQIEVALDKLEQMRAADIPVQPWLHDLFVYTFCMTGDFDEVLHFMRYRIDNFELDLSATLWYYILDTASCALHHDATLYVWRKRVESGYLNPSSGICINVLNTAARHGNFRLASDVFRILGNRTNSLQPYHYEALLESYLAASDLRTALSVLTLMTASPVIPTEATTRPLYLYLREASDRPLKAFDSLCNQHKANKLIPTVAINAVIEALIYQNNISVALETYRNLHTLCPGGPTTATFNALFRGCSKARRKDLAMFLASEMLALKVEPDALTYDRLVLVCVDATGQGDLDDAWKYFEEMKGGGWWPRRGTLVAMARRLCETGDERVWGLVEEMEGRGMDVVGVQRWVGENWKKKVDVKAPPKVRGVRELVRI